jgi:hypothetical protein
VVVALLFVLTLGMAAALLASSRPDTKKNPLSMAHSRVEVLVFLLSCVLSIAFVLLRDSNPWAIAIINLLGSLAMVGGYIYFLPYLDQRVNRLYAAFCSVFVATAATAVLALALVGSVTSVSPGIVWLFLLPLSVHAGWTQAAARWRSFASFKRQDLASPFLVELRIRYLLAEGLSQRPAASTGGAAAASFGPGSGSGTGSPSYGGASPSHRLLQQSKFTARVAPDGDEASITGPGSTIYDQAALGAVGRRFSAGIPAPRASLVGAPSSVPPPASYCPVGFDGGEGSAALAAAGSSGRRPPLSEAGMAIEKLIRDAKGAFGTAPHTYIFAAQAIRSVSHNIHRERLHLRIADASAERFDIDWRFFAYARGRELEEEESKASGGKMTPSLRMEFETQQLMATKLASRCRTVILQFFVALSERSPDLSVISARGAEIYQIAEATERAFKKLLQIAPQSVSTLRSYAGFLLEVSNNPSLATELMTEADQIEDEASKAHAGNKLTEVVFGAPVEFDFSADGLALIRVSAKAEDGLGTVVSANTGALKLWGFSSNPRELVGRELSMLLPDPIAQVHGKFLASFLEDGRQHMTGTSRTLFGLHRQGHVFPLKIVVQPAGDEWLSIAEELSTPLSFIFFVKDDVGFRITAACRSSLTLLGINPNELKSGSVVLSRFLDLAAVEDLERSPLGEMLQVQNAAAASARSRTVISAKVQNLSMPHLQQPLYLLRYTTLTEAQAAAASGQNTLFAQGRTAGPNGPQQASDDEASDGDADSLSVGKSVDGESDHSSYNPLQPLKSSGVKKIALPSRVQHKPSNLKGFRETSDPSRESRGDDEKASAAGSSEGGSVPQAPSSHAQSRFRNIRSAVLKGDVSKRAGPAGVRWEESSDAGDIEQTQSAVDPGSVQTGPRQRGIKWAAGENGRDASKTPGLVLPIIKSGRSVASGGSGASGLSGQSSAETIRRGVRARGTKLEPSLLALRRSIIIVFVLVRAIIRDVNSITLCLPNKDVY